jgi:hypothetical protein
LLKELIGPAQPPAKYVVVCKQRIQFPPQAYFCRSTVHKEGRKEHLGCKTQRSDQTSLSSYLILPIPEEQQTDRKKEIFIIFMSF